MFQKIRNDIIMTTALAGMAGAITRAATTMLFFSLGHSKEVTFVQFAKIIFNKKELVLSLDNFGYLFLGFVAFISLGAIFTIGLSYMYFKTSTNFYLIKGVFWGIAIWVTFRALFLHMAFPGGTPHLWTHYSSVLGHVFYGLVSGYLIVKFGTFLKQPHQKTSKIRKIAKN